MAEKKNITIESIESDGKDEAVVKAGNFDAKNYLNTRLDVEKGEVSKELKIRLLPIDKDSSTPFKRIKMHNVKVPKEIAKSGFKSYVCLEKVDDIDHEKYGNKCPFCELNRSAYKKSVEADNDVDKKRWQEISLANLTSDVGIIRCIERGKEEDGPKFWKFNIRQDGKDPLNVIKKLFTTRLQESREEGEGDLNILDLDEGKDLKLTITAVMDKNTGKPTNKVSIDITDYGRIKPLTDDEEQRDAWVNDEKVWSDVFVAKTYDYLSILIDGEIPWYDRNTKKWVPKSVIDGEKKVKDDEQKGKIQEENNKMQEAEKKILSNSTASSNDDGDTEELPF